jgi:hypothetical protein
MHEKFTHWQKDGWFLGYLNDFPDSWPQGEDVDDWKVHLLDLHTGWLLPNHQYHSGELEIA